MRLNRMTALALGGALVVGGTAAWAYGGNLVPKKRPCADDSLDHRVEDVPKGRRLTTAEQARAAKVAFADPILHELLGGETPTAIPPGVVGNRPGYRVVHSPMDFGRESHGAWIVVTLSKPVSPGPHRWRMFNARYRNDCVSDGLASVTTRVLEGDGAGTLVGGKNPLATSALLVQVDLVRGRTVMVSPTSYDASHYRPIGEPEYLYRAK